MNFIFKAFYVFDSTLQFYFTIQRQYLILPTVNPAPHSRGSFTVWAIYSELFDLTTLNRHQNLLKSLAKIRRNGNMTSLKHFFVWEGLKCLWWGSKYHLFDKTGSLTPKTIWLIDLKIQNDWYILKYRKSIHWWLGSIHLWDLWSPDHLDKST